jgi:plastocyanin
MKIDITRIPMDALVIGFLLVALVGTFALAFAWIDDGDGGAAEPPAVSETPGGGETPPAGGSEIAVSMGDNFFDPKDIAVAAGASVSFALTNDGTAIHNMRIAGADKEYNTDDDAISDPDIVPGGDSATLTWDTPAEVTEIDFRCDFHPTEMVGTLAVQ